MNLGWRAAARLHFLKKRGKNDEPFQHENRSLHILPVLLPRDGFHPLGGSVRLLSEPE